MKTTLFAVMHSHWPDPVFHFKRVDTQVHVLTFSFPEAKTELLQTIQEYVVALLTKVVLITLPAPQSHVFEVEFQTKPAKHLQL